MKTLFSRRGDKFMLLACGSKKSLGIEFSYRRERSLDFRADSSVASQNKKAERHLSKLNNTITMCDNFIVQVNMVYSPD